MATKKTERNGYYCTTFKTSGKKVNEGSTKITSLSLYSSRCPPTFIQPRMRRAGGEGRGRSRSRSMATTCTVKVALVAVVIVVLEVIVQESLCHVRDGGCTLRKARRIRNTLAFSNLTLSVKYNFA